MIEPISKREWDKAQKFERALHTKSLEEGIHHYRIAYDHNFRFLDIDPYLLQQDIIEIGPADFPAIRYLSHNNCTIIEPMPSPLLEDFCTKNSIALFKGKFETYIGSLEDKEIWMFNVLQHTQDPEWVIMQAKKARIVRYFEPINTDITPYHPHSFSVDDFDRWFPRINQYYNESHNQCFHDGPCCYGIYYR
jgi:hypothetical protein